MIPIKISKITLSAAAIEGCILLGFSSVNALDKTDQLKLGEMEYLSNCGSCHGKNAKGNGPVAEFLTVRPIDLTMISKKSDGKFPQEYVYKHIDGRNMIKPHGNSLMPVWGRRFTAMVREAYDATAYLPSEVDTQALVTDRIISLVNYLESIQVK